MDVCGYLQALTCELIMYLPAPSCLTTFSTRSIALWFVNSLNSLLSEFYSYVPIMSYLLFTILMTAQHSIVLMCCWVLSCMHSSTDELCWTRSWWHRPCLCTCDRDVTYSPVQHWSMRNTACSRFYTWLHFHPSTQPAHAYIQQPSCRLLMVPAR